MGDPHEVLGVQSDATPDEIRRAYRELVREHHPDRHASLPPSALAAMHARMAEITAAFRMLNDPKEFERYRRLQQRRVRGRSSGTEPGHDGIRFTASDPRRGGSIEPAPGDPDFDYRKRAPSEFTVSGEPLDPLPWTARRRKPRGLRG